MGLGKRSVRMTPEIFAGGGDTGKNEIKTQTVICKMILFRSFPCCKPQNLSRSRFTMFRTSMKCVHLCDEIVLCADRN
jgi:hypothetical protein